MTLGGSITVQALAARPVYQTTESEFVLSALLKVQPQDRSAKRVPAVVALVIEYGPGMEHERHSEQAQQTARRIIEGLLPDDLISLTIYGERAKLVMPAEPVGDGSKAKRLVGFLDAHSLGAGANLNLALKLAADDLRLRTATGTAKRVLVLAATGTLPSSVAQERDAEAVGRTLAEEGVGIDTFGFGPDWNMGLLARLAEAGRGAMHHIPRSMDALPAARDAVQDLSALAFADVRIHVRFAKGVRLRRFMQVFPTVAHWLPLQPSEREAVTRLGDLAGDRPCHMLIELIVPPHVIGSYRLASASVTYVAKDGIKQTSAPADLLVEFADQPAPVSRELARQLETLQIYSMVEKALEARRSQDYPKVRTWLENAQQNVLTQRAHPLEVPLEQAFTLLDRGLPLTETLAKSLFLAARQPEGGRTD